MAVTVKEWTQREWTQSQVDLYDDKGDFNNLSGLSPNVTRRALKRSPAWSSHLTHSGLTAIKAMFYDEANARYVLIGTNAASHLASTYFSSAWSHIASTYELSAATSGPGDRSCRNALYSGGYVYVIGADKHVYRGASYTSALSDFYSTADAVALAVLGGRVYMAATYGKIWRLNDANDAFETHYDSIANFYPLFMTAFRGYLLIVGKQYDGAVHLYRLSQSASESNPAFLHEITRVPHASADYPAYGSLFALHDDKLFFSPGRYTNPDATKVIDIYSFNGSQVEHVAQVPDSVASPGAAGLIHWRGELLFYAPSGTGTQNYKMLVGNQFVDAIPGTINVTGLSAIAANLGGELVTVGLDGSSNHGIHHAGGAALQDGHLVTARLDMDHPGLQKLLNHIVVLLDGTASDFKIVIKYRVNDNTSWTTATTGNNTYRAIASDIAAHFYTLQLRIELDDDTVAGDQDIRILSTSVVYTIEGP
jgi:hypothetical protein